MKREEFVESIVFRLLTNVDPDLLMVMSDNARRLLDPVLSRPHFLDKWNLNDVKVSVFSMLSEVDRLKCREIFADRYRRMVNEFLDIKEKLVFHEKISDKDLENEILDYVYKSDNAFGASICRVATNEIVKSAVAVNEAKTNSDFAYSISAIEKQNLSLTIEGLKKNVSLTSAQCTQWFDKLETSTKGMVKLVAKGGKDFVFQACYIDKVVPCFKAERQNDFAFIYDTFRYLSGGESPKKEIYTAIHMKGKYEGLIFVMSNFDDSFKKLRKAIDTSNSIQDKRHGYFS